MIKHSPVPWVAEENVIKQQLNDINKYDRDIGHMYNEKLGIANARHIVKAVNCHGDLVIACQDALSHLFQELEAIIDEDLKTEYQRVIDVLQQALSKTEMEG
jgi:hypothetical protein